MSFNPYAPPAEPFAPPPAGGVPSMGSPEGWEPTEVVGTAWNLFKQHWATLVFAPMVGQIIAGIPGQLPQIMLQSGARDETTIAVVTGISSLLGWIAGAFFAVGITRIMISTARGQTPNFGDIFSGGPRFLPMLGAQLLVGLIVMIGFILLIVPGIIAALALSQVTYFVVDQNMGPIEAIKASWNVTEGQKGKIFLYGFVSIGVVLLGFLACCIGIIPASAVVALGSAIIYTRLTGTGGTSGFGGMPMQGGFGGPPGGGYGPPPGGGFGGPPGGGYGPPPGGGFGGPPQGGGYGPPPGGFGGPPQGGGYGPPPGGFGGPPQGGGYGGPPQGGGYGPPGGGYGGPPQGGGYGG